MVLPRTGQIATIRSLLRSFPVVAIVGPRQAGKTTLARQVAARWKGPSTLFDLENARDRARLLEPLDALESLRGLVVLDEVQRHPGLFETLRVLADRPRGARFLVLGSAAPALLRQSSESLAGRIAIHELAGLSLAETGVGSLDRLWLRGGYPRSFTAHSDAQSLLWRRALVRTLLERELPALGIGIPPTTLARFWQMLAHYHGQTWNSSELARAFGVTDHTVRNYLDVLTSTFLVRQLRPWHENLAKRQVKAPKVYLADTGILHALLGIEDQDGLLGHPKVGASWEWHCLTSVLAARRIEPDQCYFWSTHAGAELDLLVVRGKSRYGVEVKRTTSPSVTPSMRTALVDLKLDSLDVIHAGRETYPLARRIRAVAARRLLKDL